MVTTTGSGPAVVLLDQPREPLVVHRPPGQDADGAAARPWVIMLHAPGENRTGNNYWQAQAATALAAAGLTAVRFDLSGYGESLDEKDPAAWARQVNDAIATAREHGADPVHVVARGLHAALLADAGAGAEVGTGGLRIALFPPSGADLRWWSRDRASGVIEIGSPLDASERAFWEACGAEPDLVRGLRVPAAAVDGLVGRLRDGVAWDVAVVAGRDRGPAANTLVCGREPLTRLESDRRGLEYLLVRYLRMPSTEVRR
ncbi:hypothetical protein ACQPZP_41650 [Spirillospora sp. CA-142024]|uniref:hypothetical protein n=1 Tax=Spirillospora sp. CA-142024 TaxID=3240036 RepID=UPI003D90E41D